MMIQDIAPHKLFNQYDPQAKAEAEDFAFVPEGGKILAKVEDGELLYPRVRELKNADPAELQYLFRVDEERYFLYVPKKPLTAEGAADGYGMLSMNELRESMTKPKHRIYALYTGKHLADWYRDTQFCGRCGNKMIHSATERAMTCPACHYTAYPRIMPAVIVGVINGEKLLLTRYARGYGHNALIAGFTEIGETAEETVAREVMEETGVRVKNIRYYKSQPWGSANDLLLGYYCEVDGDDTITVDHSELKTASWVQREEIELQPDENSLTNEMMMMFKTGRVTEAAGTGSLAQ